MIFRRTFQLPRIDATAEQRIVEFWRRRGVELRRVDERTWRGRRGCFWGRLATSDPTRWPSDIAITAAPDGTADCALSYSDTWTSFWEPTRPIPDVELQVFEDYVRTGEDDAAKVRSAVGAARRALWTWIRTSRFGSRGPRHVKSHSRWVVVALRVAAILMALGALVAAFGAITLGRELRQLGAPASPAYRLWGDAVVASLESAICLLLASALSRWSRQSARCLSAEQVAAQFGTTLEKAQRSLAERSVKPRFIVDGLPVYDPAHVTEAGLLLRPADPPTGETLLRAASAAEQADPATLLRPAGPEEPAKASAAP